MANKTRLDVLLMDRQLASSRNKAAAMIMAGEVKVNDRLVDKPGAMIQSDAAVTLKDKPRYVGRGGLKLEAALKSFAIEPAGKICADVGASTGGFTDCLLQHGARKVYAIDVGSGILDYRLRIDERVILLENTNARYLDTLPESPALAVIDVSFISLRLILPAVKRWIATDADVIGLVKPQFEAGKADVGKGGIVRKQSVHRRVLEDIAAFANSRGFAATDVLRSPITGAKGNIEFLLWLQLRPDLAMSSSIQHRIDALFDSSD